jgi:uncharacterized Fe-S cluster protein YjdI
VRGEEELFADLLNLCGSPGYVHALSLLSFRDNFVRFRREIKAKDMDHIFSRSRLRFAGNCLRDCHVFKVSAKVWVAGSSPAMESVEYRLGPNLMAIGALDGDDCGPRDIVALEIRPAGLHLVERLGIFGRVLHGDKQRCAIGREAGARLEKSIQLNPEPDRLVAFDGTFSQVARWMMG